MEDEDTELVSAIVSAGEHEQRIHALELELAGLRRIVKALAEAAGVELQELVVANELRTSHELFVARARAREGRL